MKKSLIALAVAGANVRSYDLNVRSYDLNVRSYDLNVRSLFLEHRSTQYLIAEYLWK